MAKIFSPASLRGGELIDSDEGGARFDGTALRKNMQLSDARPVGGYGQKPLNSPIPFCFRNVWAAVFQVLINK